LSKDERFLVEPAAELQPLSSICGRFLRKLSGTASKERRLTILKACAKVKAPWVEELLWEMLGDSSEGVRDFLVRELARRQTLDLGHALWRLDRPPWYAKSAVLKLLGIHRVRESVGDIKRLIDDSTNTDIRRSAAEALGEIGGAEALRVLVGLKKDANSYVRQAAEEAILKASEVRFI
jgi:hypothetical protein